MSHLLIICPLKFELKHLAEGLTRRGWNFEINESKKITIFHEKAKNVSLAVGGHGKTQFAIQTQHLIALNKNISGVICLGAGGALDDELKIGDLILGSKSVEHDYCEKFNRSAKLPVFYPHPELLKRAESIRCNSGFEVRSACIASGDEDVVDLVRASEIQSRTDALAVAWEGSGGARACAFLAIPFLEIRVITDHCRGSVLESFTSSISQGMDHAAEFIDLLSEMKPKAE